MKLSEAAREIEEYMEKTYMSYDYDIERAEHIFLTNSYSFYIREDNPMGSSIHYYLVVTSSGHILNKNGDDVIEGGLDAYDNDEETQKLFNNFKEKWYKKGEN